MRIVHIITRLIVGGAQENTILSCEGQHDRGHEVFLLTGPPVGPEGSLLDRAQGYGYRVELFDEMIRSIHPSKDWRVYRRLTKRLRELNPDIVHTHSSKAGIIGRWSARQAGCRRIIHTIHGLAFTASKKHAVNYFYKWLEKKTAPITHRIVCVADEMARQSLEAGIGQPQQYVTVYSGMEIEPFVHPRIPREQIRESLGITPDQIVAGTIARLFHMKGHEDLLELAPQLCHRFPKLRFLWIGDGLLRQSFEQRIQELGLEDRFILTGLVPPTRVPELVQAMDILVHPSRREGLARALPQGQLAGCPVITYDVDGNREGLIDGQTGYLVRPFDRERLGECLADLLDDPEKMKRMGACGRQFASQRFDTRVMIDRLEQVYRDQL